MTKLKVCTVKQIIRFQKLSEFFTKYNVTLQEENIHEETVSAGQCPFVETASSSYDYELELIRRLLQQNTTYRILAQCPFYFAMPLLAFPLLSLQCGFSNMSLPSWPRSHLKSCHLLRPPPCSWHLHQCVSPARRANIRGGITAVREYYLGSWWRPL